MSQYREFIGQVVRALPDEDELDGRMQKWIDDPSALRTALRSVLLPLSTITTTGDEDLQLPDWVKEVTEDVTEPTGTIELEIIKALKPNETSISGEEIRRRARANQANLGLRHAQAFLTKYRNEGFGLPNGTYITFPGTIGLDANGSLYVPVLEWGTGVFVPRPGTWCLGWDPLDDICTKNDCFFRFST